MSDVIERLARVVNDGEAYDVTRLRVEQMLSVLNLTPCQPPRHRLTEGKEEIGAMTMQRDYGDECGCGCQSGGFVYDGPGELVVIDDRPFRVTYVTGPAPLLDLRWWATPAVQPEERGKGS